MSHYIRYEAMLTTFEDDTSDKMDGVTFPQNSIKMAIVMLCGSDDGAVKYAICSK